MKLRRELGEAVVELLADENVEHVLLNPDSSLWVKRIGGDFNPVGFMAPETAMSALSTVAAWRGTVLNHDNPILETELPIDGSRFEGIVSPAVVSSTTLAVVCRQSSVHHYASAWSNYRPAKSWIQFVGIHHCAKAADGRS